MKAKKIIIVSCGDITDVMIDGELYRGIMAVNFSHDGGENNELRLTGDPIPTVDNAPENRADFMQKIAEFSKVPESHLQKRGEFVEEADRLAEKLAADIRKIFSSGKEREHEVAEKTKALADLMSARATTY